MEEPPKNTFFFLIARNPEEVLPTLKSRCQVIRVGPIGAHALRPLIPENHENPDQIINRAAGNYNHLLSLMNENIGGEFERYLIMVLRFAFKARGNKRIVTMLMNWSNEIASHSKEEQKAFLIYGIQFFRDAFLLNYNLKEIVHFKTKNNFDLSKFAPYLDSENILDIIDLFEKTHYYILRNANSKMLFATLALKLTKLINSQKK